MSNRLRYAALALFMLIPAVATAQSPAERAAKLNEQGKTLWQKENNLEGAAEKFRQATALSPEARYFFNLCYALHQLHKYREAMTECEKVGTAQGADDNLRKKAEVVIGDCNKQLANAPDEGYPDNGNPDNGNPDNGNPDNGNPDNGNPDNGNPDNGNPDNGNPDPNNNNGTVDPGSGPGGQPIAGLFQPAEIPDDYKWAIGADLGFHAGNLGNSELYTGSGIRFKGYIDFMWLPHQRVGAQLYFGLAQVGAQDGVFEDDGLQIIDLGAALYKHVKRNRFYFTPLVGAQIAGIQPINSFADNNTAAAVGLRAEAAISWLVGPNRRHVLSITPGLNMYFAAGGDEVFVSDNGLDKTSASFSLTVGYALRFTTPFGQSSLITLE